MQFKRGLKVEPLEMDKHFMMRLLFLPSQPQFPGKSSGECGMKVSLKMETNNSWKPRVHGSFISILLNGTLPGMEANRCSLLAEFLRTEFLVVAVQAVMNPA